MDNFREIVDAIHSTRNKSAKFYKVDLHVHSRESHDFPKIGDKPHCAQKLNDIDKNSREQDYFDAASNRGLKLMVITDHNKSRFAAQLAKVSRETNGNLVVLPGMEVTLQTSLFPDSAIHVLVVFPNGYSSEDVQSIFDTESGMPIYEQRDEQSITKTPLKDFIQRVHKKNGLCIASHVNSNKGMRAMFRDGHSKLLRTKLEIKSLKKQVAANPADADLARQLIEKESSIEVLEDDVQNQFLELLSEFEFDAVEVQKSSDFQFYNGQHTKSLGIRDIPCVLGSDSHNVQDIGLKDSTTYIKMTTPGFLDLRKALRDPGTRIRYEDTLNTKKYSRILGISLDGHFFRTPTIGFSDNLTCMIGGRGTGKSATIEALRRAFDQDLSHLGDDKKKDIAGRKEHTLSDTKITVLFENQYGNLFVLVDEKGEETKCFDINGNPLPGIRVAVDTDMKVKIYGWGEIEELARDKREQLKLIDGFIPEARSLTHTTEDLLARLEKNTDQIFGLTKEIEDLLPRVAELSSKERQLTLLNTPELDNLFSDFDRNESALSAIDVLNREVLDLASKLKENGQGKYSFGNKFDQVLQTAQNKTQELDWSNAFIAEVAKQAKSIQPAYEELLSLFETLSMTIKAKSNDLESNRQSIEENLITKAKNLTGDEYKDNPSKIIERRGNLTKEVSDLRAIKDSIDARHTKILDLLETRFQEIVPDLVSNRVQLTELRKSKIQEMNERLSDLSNIAKVTIDVLHQGEKSKFIEALGSPEPKKPDGVLKGVYKWYKKYNYAGLYAEKFSPHEFVQAILYPKDDFSNLTAQGVYEQNDVEVDLDRAKDVANHLSPYAQDKPYFNSEKLRTLLALEQLDIQDFPIICLDSQQIEELSPGQRCSTLIPIILLESSCPLIIDQPEDNLDNKLVFDLVVDILRSLKEQRQIIVATHNPNIPVSGDAEQIIVFEAPSRQECKIIEQGSIDDPGIVRQIKSIMEGSDDAFRIRAEKYGYRLNAFEQNN